MKKIIVFAVFRLLPAIFISLVFFIGIPVIQNFFGYNYKLQKNNLRTPKILMEKVLLPPKKHLSVRKNIKNITSDTKSFSYSKMEFNFAPDLNVASDKGVSGTSGDLSVEVFNEGDVDEKPVPIYTPNVTYPSRAIELEIEGSVKLKLMILRNGRVGSVSIVESPHPILSDAVKKTVLSWRFKPGKKNGIPVKVLAEKVIEFKFDND